MKLKMTCTQSDIKAGYVCLLLSLIIAVTSCEKENGGGQPYRVTSITHISDGQPFWQEVISYSENRISLIIIYQIDHNTGTKTEKYRITYSYPDSLTCLEEIQDSPTGVFHLATQYTFEGGQVSHIVTYFSSMGVTTEDQQWIRTYTGNNLESSTYDKFENGAWVHQEQYFYDYYGSVIVQGSVYEYDQDWYPTYKEVVNFAGDRIDYIYKYEFDGFNFNKNYKSQYSYSDGKITEIDYYSLEAGQWKMELYFDSFEYDKNGNVKRWRTAYHGLNDEIENVEFGYEKGTGNWRQLNDHWYDHFHLMTIPAPSVASKKDYSAKRAGAIARSLLPLPK